MTPHAVVVLAAGGSRRLGQPKQLLQRGRETLLGRALRLASATLPARMLVITGGNVENLAAELDSWPCEQVHNPQWTDGLSSSLRAAATRLCNFEGRVLVLGCDQPALELEHLIRLLDGADQSALGVSATSHAGAAGVPAVVPAHWFEDLTASGDEGFRHRLRSLPTDDIALLHDAALQQDLDDVEALTHARARGWLDPVD